MSDTFKQLYEAAIDDLTAEELAEVAALNKTHLREWVMAPAKIRPHLLIRWRNEKSAAEQMPGGILQVTTNLSDRLKSYNEEHRKTWFNRLARRLIR